MSQAVTDLADEPSSLLEWATRLAVDPQLRARLAADPRGLLGEQGFAHVLPADLHHALPLVTDGVAARLGHDVDPGLVGPVAAQYAGEHPLDALARQFTHVSEAVLAGPPSDVPGPDVEHDLDDPVVLGAHDPTAVLDDLTEPHDLDAPADAADEHGDRHDHLDQPVHLHHPAADPQPAPVVGNGAAASDELDGAVLPFPEHTVPDLPDLPEHHDHAEPDAHHLVDPVDVHPVHDVLDL